MGLELEKAETELDKLLRAELNTVSPSENRIVELVKQGANISGDFLLDAIFCYTTQPERGKSLDVKYFKLFIELGADINYDEDGWTCLDEARLSNYQELVELLREKFVNTLES